MEINIRSFFLMIDAYSFIWVLYFFLSIMALLLISIIIFSFYKRKLESKKKLWRENIANIISQVILFENDGTAIWKLNADDEIYFRNKNFRQYFIDKIIHAKKNISGAPVANLVNCYEKLSLDKDALQKLKSKKWHIKARGIHELAVMEQLKYVKEIFRLTNDSHELVRNEAQCAIVSFYGFKGLRFLNVIVHPVSQWQQIQLLNYVHDLQSAEPKFLKKWLRSENNSVVTFALYLSSLYNCTDVYQEVILCLQNPDRQVKLNALDYLKKVNTEETANEIIACFSSSEKIIRLHILSVLQETGGEKQIPFLLKQLQNADHTIKLAAAKTLACIHPLGAAFLHSYLFADEYPWTAIFSQIDNERAA